MYMIIQYIYNFVCSLHWNHLLIHGRGGCKSLNYFIQPRLCLFAAKVQWSHRVCSLITSLHRSHSFKFRNILIPWRYPRCRIFFILHLSSISLLKLYILMSCRSLPMTECLWGSASRMVFWAKMTSTTKSLSLSLPYSFRVFCSFTSLVVDDVRAIRISKCMLYSLYLSFTKISTLNLILISFDTRGLFERYKGNSSSLSSCRILPNIRIASVRRSLPRSRQWSTARLSHSRVITQCKLAIGTLFSISLQ